MFHAGSQTHPMHGGVPSLAPSDSLSQVMAAQMMGGQMPGMMPGAQMHGMMQPGMMPPMNPMTMGQMGMNPMAMGQMGMNPMAMGQMGMPGMPQQQGMMMANPYGGQGHHGAYPPSPMNPGFGGYGSPMSPGFHGGMSSMGHPGMHPGMQPGMQPGMMGRGMHPGMHPGEDFDDEEGYMPGMGPMGARPGSMMYGQQGMHHPMMGLPGMSGQMMNLPGPMPFMQGGGQHYPRPGMMASPYGPYGGGMDGEEYSESEETMYDSEYSRSRGYPGHYR